MGTGSWSSKDWKLYSEKKIEGRSAKLIFTTPYMQQAYNPKNVTVRESCDSPDHPNSNAIIIGLDVTGSMQDILESTAQKLGVLVQEVYERKPISDPQIMFCAIGDSDFDDFPFQVTQFESDIRIAEQLTELCFEEGGGPNFFESYPLAWYFAARHTTIDCYEKRRDKGFLFTMGDDCYPDKLTKEEIQMIFGDTVQADIPVTELLDEVNRKYDVFHLILDRRRDSSNIEKWRELMGQRVIKVSDHTKIPEIIVSILETMNGKSVERVAESWDDSTAVVVRDTLNGLSTMNATSELVTF